MYMREIGGADRPKVILLHPMLADGTLMMKLAEGFAGDYCFLAPDLSGQGCEIGRREFTTAAEDAREIAAYLKRRDYREIALLFGASLGARVGLEMLTDPELAFRTVVFEGAPLYRDARLTQAVMCAVFLKKNRKAKANPGLSAQKMTAQYGAAFGPVMGGSFERMSEASIRAIVKACCSFSFPAYPAALQDRMFFEFGSRDPDAKQQKNILRQYPGVHIRLREGYGHCQYMAEHYQEYGRLLEEYMKYAEGRPAE